VLTVPNVTVTGEIPRVRFELGDKLDFHSGFSSESLHERDHYCIIRYKISIYKIHVVTMAVEEKVLSSYPS
jgi:hypothetical protein